MKKQILFFLLAAVLSWTFSSCRSIERMAIGKISDMMSSDDGAGAFARDDDPQLIADALPFALKMYEMLLSMNPEDAPLNLAAGKAFIMYANGFIQTPASMLGDDDFEKQAAIMERARKMYLRGRNYVLKSLALEIRDYQELMDNDFDALLGKMKKDNVPALYWAAAGWLGAFSCDPFNMEQGLDIYKPVAMVFRALELDESYEKGAIHDMLLTLWSSMPEALIQNALRETPGSAGAFAPVYYSENQAGESPGERSLFHFNRAIELSEGQNPGTFVTMAQGFPVKEQNYHEFESLLKKALAIDPKSNPDMELLVIIYQDKARWLLEHREDYFLTDF